MWDGEQRASKVNPLFAKPQNFNQHALVFITGWAGKTSVFDLTQAEMSS